MTCLFLSAFVFGRGQSVIEPPEVTRMMDEYIRFNKENPKMKGWRIQVLATTERRLMERTKSRFESRYPDFDLDFEHRNPFYLLKTGAFLTRNDALPLLNRIQKDFSSAFLVSEEIEVKAVLDNPY